MLLLNVIGDASVIEAFPPLVCFVVFMLDQRSFSTYLRIIVKLTISFYISFYSWDLTKLLLMCVQVMKQGMIEGFGVFFEVFFFHTVFEFLGCKCSSSSNFSLSSVASWCCLGTFSLSFAIILSFFPLCCRMS